MKRQTVLVVALLAGLILILILLTVFLTGTPSTPSTSKAPRSKRQPQLSKIEMRRKLAEESFKKMTPEEHYLAIKTRTAPEGYSLELHFAAIPPESQYHKKAKQCMDQIAVEQKKAEEAARKQHLAEEKGQVVDTIEQRRFSAKLIEENWLRGGIDADVTTQGKYSEYMVVSMPLMSKSLAYQLWNEGEFSHLFTNHSFKKVTFKNNITEESWSYTNAQFPKM